MDIQKCFFIFFLYLLANNQTLPSLQHKPESPLAKNLSISSLNETSFCSKSTIDQTKAKFDLENNASFQVDNEINSTKRSLVIGTLLTTTAFITTQSIDHFKEKRSIRRSLISAGDVFGAGGVAEGTAGIVKGIALAIAAGGAIFVARKFYSLIDLRIEAQEQKHKTDKELALRKNNEEWRSKLQEMLDEQKNDIENILEQRDQNINNKFDKNKSDLLTKIISPLVTSIASLRKDLDREKERTHRRNEPIIQAITNINEFLTTKLSNISPSGSTLGELKKNIDELNNKEESSSSGNNETFNNQLDEIKKVIASVSNQGSHTAVYTMPALRIVEPKVTEKEKTCCPC